MTQVRGRHQPAFAMLFIAAGAGITWARRPFHSGNRAERRETALLSFDCASIHQQPALSASQPFERLVMPSLVTLSALLIPILPASLALVIGSAWWIFRR
jgi:hypothetical protein